MKILKKLKTPITRTYIGVCNRCGTVFEAEFPKDFGVTPFVPELVCKCPECGSGIAHSEMALSKIVDANEEEIIFKTSLNS